MKAHKLLENAALDPGQLKTIYKAFDDAWEVVKSQYEHSPTSTEVGRLRLANALLGAYRNGATDPDALKAAAIQSMQRGG